MSDADVDAIVPRKAPSLLPSAGARYPLVDPQGVTFLYQGAADSVGTPLLDPRACRRASPSTASRGPTTGS